MRVALLLVSLLVAGCDRVPFTKVKPQPQNLVGLYRPTGATQAALIKAGYTQANTPALVLKADGKFEMKSMPDKWLHARSISERSPNPSYDSGSGIWRIEPSGEGWARRWGILLDFPGTKDLVSRSHTGRSGRLVCSNLLMLRNDKPPYVLHFIVGDPDSDDGLEFVRENQ
jgi:hypothetical protein